MTSKRIIRFGLLIAWLGITVFLSRQPGADSAHLSYRLASKVISIFSLDISVREFNVYLREFAHFSVHFVLGLLAYRAFIAIVRYRIGVAFSFALAGTVAVIDEFAQRFVTGRVWEISDIIANLLGVSVGIIFGIIVSKPLRE